MAEITIEVKVNQDCIKKLHVDETFTAVCIVDTLCCGRLCWKKGDLVEVLKIGTKHWMLNTVDVSDYVGLNVFSAHFQRI